MHEAVQHHLPLSTPVYQILLSLSDRVLPGYAVIRDVRVRTNGEVELKAGTLNGALRRMLDAGMVQETDRPTALDEDDPVRRYYVVTPFGRAVARAEAERLQRALAEARAVEQLASRATFEEMTHLLWHDELPDRDQLRALGERLAAARELPEDVMELLRRVAARDLPPITALRMAAGALDLDIEDGDSDDRALAEHVVARLQVLIASYARLVRGEEPPPPRTDLGAAANYLCMLTGREPLPDRIRALETYWNTVADGGLDTSMFAARAIVSTRSDLVSAVAGAVGALKGRLHRGAPGTGLDMVLEIVTSERAEPFIREKLERGERLMGFGHRVHEVRDPRTDVLAAAVGRLERSGEFERLYELARHVERVALDLLEEYKPGRRFDTRAEFYGALLLQGLGLGAELFTPTFAAARVVGWIAHCFDQLETGRILQPHSDYMSHAGRRWVARATARSYAARCAPRTGAPVAELALASRDPGDD